ncbi:MAG: twin-arginine translocase TatA/TatE family subunit [Chloroflexi bacterium]|nr:twin-arginine translocase TatA/TatE family subunit [Chloroflexota bacterium]|tara:strand:+ start:1311 stop:1484 length:174 start_codon:yes stop_codon:yes gene_type:complete
MGFIQNLGLPQLALIAFIVLLLFGVGKLPQVGDGLGKAINNFKNAIGKSEDKEDKDK